MADQTSQQQQGGNPKRGRRNGGGNRGGDGERRNRGGNSRGENTSSNRSSPRGGRGGRGRGGRNHQKQRDGNPSAAHQDIQTAPVDQPQCTKRTENPNPIQPEVKRAKHSTPGGSTTHLSSTRFDSLVGISDQSKRALSSVLKFENLTVVQEATLPTILTGKDVLAKAKTGTGKTIGFLLPSLERIEYQSTNPKTTISMLVLSPTRELATQIETEAKQLATFHAGLSIGCITGGVSMGKDSRLFAQGIHVLVATPGRLIDHLKNTPRFSERFKSLRVLVLDEADQLLERGFRLEIEQILSFLPAKDSRQTLLFSATVPKVLLDVAAQSLKPNHEFINTVSDEDSETNVQVSQSAIVCPLEKQIQLLDLCLQQHIAECPEYKVIVFFPTARLTGFMAMLFERAGMSVVEMHSRKSQAYRTKASARFRDNTRLVMFSSDVSARGMDYDGVSLIVQVGFTEREQYIHRLGRTARAGMQGRGVLILAPFEKSVLGTLSELPVTIASDEEVRRLCESPLRPGLASALEGVARNSQMTVAAEQAYQAFLGFYKSNLKHLTLNVKSLIETTNQYALCLGLSQPPAIFKKVVGKMGLSGQPGLRLK